MTGTLLKEAREKQNLSISEVSMSTKINPKVIAAIEDGREGQLPAKTFLKGFVRSYAIYLKLDVDQVMATLQQDLGEKQEPAVDQAAATAAPEKVESPSISANPKVLKGLAAGGVMFLIVMIVTVKGLVEKYEKEKALDPAVQAELNPEESKPEEENASEETATAEAAKPADQKTADAAKPAETQTAPAKPEVAPAASLAATPATTETKPTVAPEVKKPEPKPEAKTEVQAAVNPEVKPAPASVATAPAAKPAEAPKVEAPKPPEAPAAAVNSSLKDNEIILEALDKVDVTFAVNNGPVQKISLQPSQVHTIKAKGQVAMDVSDGGAVNVILNGQDNGTIGDLGKPKKMKYP